MDGALSNFMSLAQRAKVTKLLVTSDNTATKAEGQGHDEW